jgi:hypothetical protein
VVVGANRTLIVQLPPGATVPQLLVCWNWFWFGPLLLTPVTVRLALPVLVTVTGVFPDTVLMVRLPKAIEAGVRERTGVPLMPVPVSATVCGEFGALLVIVSVAVFAPVVVGANRTLIVQLPPGATEVHPLVCWNWPGFVPVRATLVMFKVAVPVLVTTTGEFGDTVLITRFPKGIAAVETLAASVGAVAVPVRVTVLGEPAALCTMLTAAFFVPAVVGENCTSIVQAAPGATVVHPLLMPNWFGFAPVNVALDTARVAVPVFVTMIDTKPDWVLTLREAKAIEVGLTTATGTGTGVTAALAAEVRCSAVPWLSVKDTRTLIV